MVRGGLGKLYRDGEPIVRQGSTGNSMYVVQGGLVEVVQQSDDGREQHLAFLEAGDFFGEMCMLEEDTPRSATAFAVADVNAVMIDQSAFTFILKHNPEIAIRMMRKLALRLEHTTKLLEEAVGHKVDIDHSGISDRPTAKPDPNARLVEISSGLAFPLASGKETTVGRVDPVLARLLVVPRARAELGLDGYALRVRGFHHAPGDGHVLVKGLVAVHFRFVIVVGNSQQTQEGQQAVQGNDEKTELKAVEQLVQPVKKQVINLIALDPIIHRFDRRDGVKVRYQSRKQRAARLGEQRVQVFGPDPQAQIGRVGEVLEHQNPLL